jgi:hypothetical protein
VHEKNIDKATQRVGCPHHLLIPQLLESFAEFCGYDESNGEHVIFYKHRETGAEFQNGPHGKRSYTSKELCEMPHKDVIGDPGIEALRDTFQAQHRRK